VVPPKVQCDAIASSSLPGDSLKHDPEKWEPVFGKDHEQTKAKAG
jgi:hypothetical protein